MLHPFVCRAHVNLKINAGPSGGGTPPEAQHHERSLHDAGHDARPASQQQPDHRQEPRRRLPLRSMRRTQVFFRTNNEQVSNTARAPEQWKELILQFDWAVKCGNTASNTIQKCGYPPIGRLEIRRSTIPIEPTTWMVCACAEGGGV